MSTILLIEDDIDLQEEIRDLLLYERFSVFCASDGEQAWQLLATCQPDLILSGVKMPGENGFDWLKRLRAQPEYALTPFVFLTGLSSVHEHRQAMLLGADDYLIKPVRAHDLLVALHTRLERADLIRKNQQNTQFLHHDILMHHFPHELLTPLNALMGMAHLIKQQHSQLAPHRLLQLSEVMIRNGSRLNHLIQNQLLFMELDNGLIPQLLDQATELDLAPLVLRLAQERAEYYQRESDLQFQLESGTTRMLEKHAVTIFRELIDNAFKFSTAGQPVLLSTALDERGLIFEVTDAGRGFSPEQLEQVGAYIQFERTSQEQQGIGLGLELVRRLIQLYHAHFEIDSVPQRYTSIAVRFALSEA